MNIAHIKSVHRDIINDLKINRDYAKKLNLFYKTECKDTGLEELYLMEKREYELAIEILKREWDKREGA